MSIEFELTQVVYQLHRTLLSYKRVFGYDVFFKRDVALLV